MQGHPRFPGRMSHQQSHPSQGSNSYPVTGSDFSQQGPAPDGMRPHGIGPNGLPARPPPGPPFQREQAQPPPGWPFPSGPPPLHPPPVPPPLQHSQAGPWNMNHQAPDSSLPERLQQQMPEQNQAPIMNPLRFPPGQLFGGPGTTNQDGPGPPGPWPPGPWSQRPPPLVGGGQMPPPPPSGPPPQQHFSQAGQPGGTMKLPNMSLPPPGFPPPGFGGPGLPPPSLPPNSLPQYLNSDAPQSETEASAMNKSLAEGDKEWLDGWLNRKGVLRRLRVKRASSSMSIPEAKQILREILVKTEELERMTEKLKQGMTSPSSEWAKDLQYAQELKESLCKLKSRLGEKDILENLSAKMKKSHAKRERLKRIRRSQYVNEREAEAKREVLHAELDRWQETLLQQEDNKLKMKEMQKAADATLAEVRRKINEAQRGIEVLTALRKLREVRKDAAQHRGLYTPLDTDKAFEHETTSMIHALRDQLKIYEGEKRTLEVMLDAEKEETKERDDEAHRRKKRDTLEKKYNLIQSLLFGKPVKLDESDPHLPYHQFYESSRNSLPAFLQIRHEWDQFLVPEGTAGGTRMPAGWINPPQPANLIWASYLKDNQPQS